MDLAFTQIATPKNAATEGALYGALGRVKAVVLWDVRRKVVLRGTVRSWAEQEEAWRAPGVTEVENHIAVVPVLEPV